MKVPLRRLGKSYDSGLSGSSRIDSQEEDRSMNSEQKDGMELAAAELVACVKRAAEEQAELLVPDETCLWVVTVKRMGIAGNGSA
jgi:hypothetical protein